MDSGPAKQRRRGKRPDVLSVEFNMNTDQVNTLRNFIDNTIQGVIRFGFPHPRTEQVVEVRIVPQGEGELFGLTYILPNYWRVTLQLEVLP
jgi:hypothetical protein